MEFSNIVDEIFNSDDEYHVRSDFISRNELSRVCWIKTINVIYYKNGTKSEDRDYSIIFDNNDNINRNISNEINDDPKFNFTTQFSADNFTININKSITCGLGNMMTKVYTHWGSKQRLQVNIGSKKLLKEYRYRNTNKGEIKYNEEEKKLSKNKIKSLSNFDDTKSEPKERVKKQTNDGNDNKSKTVYKALITVKIFKIEFNEEDRKYNDTVIREYERKLDINQNVEGSKMNITEKSVKQAWNKFSKVLVLKLNNEPYNANKTIIF